MRALSDSSVHAGKSIKQSAVTSTALMRLLIPHGVMASSGQMAVAARF
jgi:hypothetical protein